jgi:NAD(P)-dependent dehydrogenase (short-subunit alcohol dehydrogenase family)
VDRLVSVLDGFRLDGRVAVGTGAGSGLGAGFAVALAEGGADVVAARRQDRLAGVDRRGATEMLDGFVGSRSPLARLGE